MNMGRSKRNCPSEEFLRVPPIQSFFDLKRQIETLFRIKIKSNMEMTAEKILINEEEIKIYENYQKRIRGFPQFRGDLPSYYPETGVMIIPERLYNERAFIHEALHAFSNLTLKELVDWDFEREFNITLREGITEFLTGCILFKFFPHCYEYFKKPSYYEDLDIGYKAQYNPRFWYVFVQIFGIDIILQVYFDKTLKLEKYKDVHDLLISTIKEKYRDFNLQNSYYYFEWENSLRLVSKEFRELFDKTGKILDFSVFPFLK